MSVMDIIFLIMSIFGGLGLFLYGMQIMGDGLELAAGNKLRKWLELLTNNRFLGVFIGAAITAIIQSSSATTVMVVSFVNAGLMNLMQAVGVIMGANIGTTITGVLISLNISKIAPIATFIGIIMMMFAKKKNTKHIGQIVAGFGILFMGMSIMSDSLKPLSSREEFMNIIAWTSNPFAGLLVGALLTAVIQSSSAFTGVLIALAIAGVVDLQTGIFLVLGTNIGTCITAILASISANKTAKRAAVVHLLFNVFGSVIFMFIALLPIGFVSFIESLVPNDIPKQIAVTHVIFNLTTTIVLFPFANQLVSLASKAIPGEDKKQAAMRLLYLDSNILVTPPIAVLQVRKEVERMAELTLRNYKLSIDIFLNRKPDLVDEAMNNENVLNFLNREITQYLIKINALELDYRDNKMIGSLHHVINDIERIGDHAENIVEFSQAFIDDDRIFSQYAINELEMIAADVEKNLQSAIEYFKTDKYDENVFEQIKINEEQIDEEVAMFKNNHIDRLNKNICDPVSGMLFVNMLFDLERVADHAFNIASSLMYKKQTKQ